MVLVVKVMVVTVTVIVTVTVTVARKPASEVPDRFTMFLSHLGIII